MPILQTARRRLQQGRTSTGRPSTARSENIGPVELPEPKPPVGALDEKALRELQVVSNCRDSAKLEEQIKKCLEAISKSTYAFNEAVGGTRTAVMLSSDKVKDTDRVAAMRKRLAELEGVMMELSRDSERGIREIVDLKVDIEDQKQSIEAAYLKAEVASAHKKAELERIQEALERAGLEEGADVTGLLDETGIESPAQAWQTLKGEKALQYQRLNAHQRYAKDNDYVAWKNEWHTGLHGTQVPLPDQKTWFTRDGQPVLQFNTDEVDEEMEDDGDDELVVAREVISTTCPLSLVEMTEPYTSSDCKHTFQKGAIFEYLGYGQGKPCPMSGCGNVSQPGHFLICFDPSIF